MERHLRRLSDFIIRRKVPVLIVILLITGFFAYMSTKLTVNNDHDTWLPQHNEVAKLLRQADKDFSSNIMLFAVIEFKEGVFRPDSLALMDRITQELEGIDDLFNVTSITNIIDIKKTSDGIEVGDLIPGTPKTPEEIERLKAYVLSKETYVNSIVSADQRYTAIMTNIESSRDEVLVAERIFKIIDGLAAGHTRYYGGDPSVNFYLNYYMMQDLKVLLPLGVLVVVIIIYFGLRRLSGVVLPMSIVFLAIVWTFGLMSIFGYPINIMVPAVIVLLIAMGTDYAVHYYNHHLKRGDASTSTTEISIPVTMSALTTIVSLLTFATTRIEVFKNFGVELAIGLAVAWILAIVLMAVFVSMFKVKPSEVLSQDEGETRFTRIMDAFGGWIFSHARLMLAMVGIFALGMAFGVPAIKTNVDFIGQLPKDSPPRVGCNILVDHFNGMYPFNLYVRGDLEDPAVMNRMNYLENSMRSEKSAAGFTSINALIAQENWLMNGVYAVPETRDGIANLWFMLEGHDILKTFVTEDRKKGLVNSIVNLTSTEEMRFLATRFDLVKDARISEKILTIEPSRLTEEGRRALDQVRLRDAALQLAWLANYYDRTVQTSGEVFEARLSSALAGLPGSVDMAPVWTDLRNYLTAETVEVLPEALVAGLMKRIGEVWEVRSEQKTADELAGMITAGRAMGPEDAVTTVQGLLKRTDATFRIQKALSLRQAMGDLVTPSLAASENFTKRADGVLWELVSPSPVFFSKQVEAVPGIGNAIDAQVPVRIDQAGMPATVRLVHGLLIRSQVQSLALALVAVFIMVALTYRSMRRGMMSMMTVLVPLIGILGFMGLINIPLDIGTVLCGSLIVGLGIDGSIHFLYYYNRLHLSGVPKKRALQMTMGHVGRAVCTANMTTFGGFVVCLLSDVTAVKNFALLNSIAILMVTLSVMTLLPAMVSVFHVDRVDDLEDTKPPRVWTKFSLRGRADKETPQAEEERRRAAGVMRG
ncbi:MAG: MMPL family transporter [Desulfobacterota bacterium]|nr:MMPL family transporter [Thermodesulfobacteriota bacterium]